MDDLFKTLSVVLRVVGNDPQVIEAAAIAAWKKAAGDGLRHHAVPIRLTDGKLLVAVADAVWQKQLGAMKDQLIYRTNSIIGQPLVREVELTVDPQLTRPPQEPIDNKRSLDNEVPLELWSAASAISDKELRQKFLRAASSAIRRREHDKTE
jgi:hypothetical protein